MRATVHTLGCRVNQYESEVLVERLAALTGPGEVHIVNTCTVTSLADRKSRQLVARLRREHPHAVIVAVGCGVTGSGAGLARAGADLVVGNRDKGFLPSLLEPLLRGEPVPRGGGWVGLDRETLVGPERRVRALLKVQDGCTVGCSFCRTWQVRGPLRSKTPQAARAEAESLARAGHGELVLVGVNLAQYGEDLPSRPTLVNLVQEILKVPRVRVRLSSLHPDAVTDELVALFAQEGRLCPHLHLPLQSGDDAILRAMGRPYTRAEYLERVQAFLEAVPHATLGADAMVGFPGEDEAAFRRTVDVLDQLTPLNVHIFRYSPRPGTPAARFSTRVSAPESARRAAELAERARGWARVVHERLLGGTVGVVVEGEGDRGVAGRSEGYLWVEVRGGWGTPRGTILPVRLVEAAPEHVVGVIPDRTEDSGDRVR